MVALVWDLGEDNEVADFMVAFALLWWFGGPAGGERVRQKHGYL
jgi:hypothetical protein